MWIDFVIGVGIMIIGICFVFTSEYIDGSILILLGSCWIDDWRINSELADLKAEVADLRKKSKLVTDKQPYTAIS